MNRLNILYIPWIERSTNVLIEIIGSRTDINFIPFKYFVDPNEQSNRSKINSYSRENKERLKAHMKEYLTKFYLNVDAVVVTLDWIAPINIFIESCKELNIPTILIPHESVFAKRDMYYVDYVTGIDCPVTDYVLSWGDLQKEIYSSRGYNGGKIFNVGAPKFDVYKNYKPNVSRSEFFKTIHFENNKKTILFVMQPLDSQYNEKEAREAQQNIINDLIKIAETKQYQLILRLPPALGDKLLNETLVEKLSSCSFVYLEGLNNQPLDPMDAIYNADIVVSINSTMLFESALLNKPSISIKYIEFESFWENAGIPLVYNYQELSDKISSLIYVNKSSLSKEGWEWASSQLSDGGFSFNASEKIENKLKELINKDFSENKEKIHVS